MQNRIKTWLKHSLTTLCCASLVACGYTRAFTDPGMIAPSSLNRSRQSTQPLSRLRRYSTNPRSAVPGQLIVKLRSPLNAQVLQTLSQRHRVQVIKTSPLGAVLIQNQAGMETEQLLQRLQSDPMVEYTEPNVLYRNNFTVNDPKSREQRGLALAGMAKAWDITRGDPRVIIAVIDSGVDLEHPDLKSKLVPGYNILDQGKSPPRDENGHGTHASGIAAAATDNKTGIAGAAPNCRLMPIKALDASGGGSVMDVSLGIMWAVDHGAHIINMSLGGPQTTETIERAVQYALRKDVAVVVAAGNDATNEPQYPAALPGVISVGSVDITRQLSSFSNFGNWITVVAPGSQIYSTMPTYDVFMTEFEMKNKGYDFLDGTSMAAPIVAGVVALMKSRHPQLRPAELKAHLEATAIDLGSPGFDEMYGHGLINAARAVM